MTLGLDVTLSTLAGQRQLRGEQVQKKKKNSSHMHALKILT